MEPELIKNNFACRDEAGAVVQSLVGNRPPHARTLVLKRKGDDWDQERG